MPTQRTLPQRLLNGGFLAVIILQFTAVPVFPNPEGSGLTETCRVDEKSCPPSVNACAVQACGKRTQECSSAGDCVVPTSACLPVPGCPIWCSVPFLNDGSSPTLMRVQPIPDQFPLGKTILRSLVLDIQPPPPKPARLHT